MIKEYLLENFSGDCCHISECIDRFVNENGFFFCSECSLKDYLLNCCRIAMRNEEDLKNDKCS